MIGLFRPASKAENVQARSWTPRMESKTIRRRGEDRRWVSFVRLPFWLLKKKSASNPFKRQPIEQTALRPRIGVVGRRCFHFAGAWLPGIARRRLRLSGGTSQVRFDAPRRSLDRTLAFRSASRRKKCAGDQTDHDVGEGPRCDPRNRDQGIRPPFLMDWNVPSGWPDDRRTYTPPKVKHNDNCGPRGSRDGNEKFSGHRLATDYVWTNSIYVNKFNLLKIILIIIYYHKYAAIQ
jgi:hypothetical protein